MEFKLSTSVECSDPALMLWRVTNGTDIKIQVDELLNLSTRFKLARVIQSKSAATLDQYQLDSQEINFVLKVLTNSAITNRQLDYNPAIDDICILSVVSSAIVKGEAEGLDSKVLIVDILHRLLEEAGDHGLEIIINQVRTLRRSDDQLHRELSSDIFRFLANYFLRYKDINLPELNQRKKYIWHL